MGKWKEAMLTEVTLKIGDGLHGTPNYDDKGDYYFINGNNLYQGKIVIKEETKKVNKTEFEKHKKNLSNKTILLGINGTIGNLALYNNEKCILGKSACYINVNENIHRSYLYYNLLNKDFQIFIEGIATGTTIPNVPLKGLREYQLLLPPLSEQKLIAEVLTSLDDKINLLHLNNKTLDQLAETLFRQWFVEQANENWDVLKFHELVKHVKPGTNFQPKRVLSGIPFLNVKNLDNGFLNYSDINYITPEEYKRVHKNWIPEANDILISRIGTLGIVAAITERDLPVAVHYNMINLKAKRTSFQFLYFLLKSNMFQEKYESIIRQSVQEYVAIEDVENIELRLPINHSLFQEKEKSLIELFNKVKANYSQIKYLEKLRNTLLPKLMSGLVRVEN